MLTYLELHRVVLHNLQLPRTEPRSTESRCRLPFSKKTLEIVTHLLTYAIGNIHTLIRYKVDKDILDVL